MPLALCTSPFQTPLATLLDQAPCLHGPYLYTAVTPRDKMKNPASMGSAQYPPSHHCQPLPQPHLPRPLPGLGSRQAAPAFWKHHLRGPSQLRPALAGPRVLSLPASLQVPAAMASGSAQQGGFRSGSPPGSNLGIQSGTPTGQTGWHGTRLPPWSSLQPKHVHPLHLPSSQQIFLFPFFLVPWLNSGPQTC